MGHLFPAVPFSGAEFQGWMKALLLFMLLAYLVVVRLLRYKRMKDMHKKFNYPTRASFSKMTLDDAHAIHLYLATLEFPQTFSASVFFALFKVGNPRLLSYR